MKELIGFIGVGQCGGNITQLFQNSKYKTFYINTSEEDLATLKVENYYHIKNANGSNHSRTKAIDYIKDQYESIMEQIKIIFKDQKIIYLVFSAGGGTGSGISPLLIDMLTIHCKDKIFGAVVVLPDLDESINVQVNAYNCMSQLSNIKKLGSVFVLDNAKNNKNVVNVEFHNTFQNVINLPSYVSTKGNIDIAEIIELLSVRGVAVVATTTNIDATSILASLKSSCFSFANDKQVVYIAISLTDEINLNNLINYVGKPYDTFINYNDEICICCLSGMSFPHDRINAIKTMIDNQKQDVVQSIENSKNNSIKNELQWDVKVGNGGSESLDFVEIFKKYQ